MENKQNVHVLAVLEFFSQVPCFLAAFHCCCSHLGGFEKHSLLPQVCLLTIAHWNIALSIITSLPIQQVVNAVCKLEPYAAEQNMFWYTRYCNEEG